MEWQNIETAPRDYTDVLAFSPDDHHSNTNGVSMAWFDPADGQWYSYDVQGPLKIAPSRWMPLPEAPDA